jgi:hypothetical protein
MVKAIYNPFELSYLEAILLDVYVSALAIRSLISLKQLHILSPSQDVIINRHLLTPSIVTGIDSENCLQDVLNDACTSSTSSAEVKVCV